MINYQTSDHPTPTTGTSSGGVPAPTALQTAALPLHLPHATYGAAWRAVQIVVDPIPEAFLHGVAVRFATAVTGSLLGMVSPEVVVGAERPLGACERYARAHLADRLLVELGDRVRQLEIQAVDAALEWRSHSDGPAYPDEIRTRDDLQERVDRVRLARAALAHFASDIADTWAVRS